MYLVMLSKECVCLLAACVSRQGLTGLYYIQGNHLKGAEVKNMRHMLK